MENATKALLIAAAVLVVIILIAFGMRILSSSSGTQDQADATLNSAKVQSFNQSLETYKGTRVNGSSARALITKINSMKVTDPTHAVEIAGDTTSQTAVDDTKTYTVTFEYETTGDNTGYIKKATINSNNK